MSGRAAYTRAGVDVDAGERAVELMRASVASTRRPEVLGGLGGFGSAVAIPPGFREPVIVSSTDGVGTKTAIAWALGRYDTIGQDLVAMCADDVVCSGAEPLAFLDYVAVGRLEPRNVAELVAGVAEGCRQAGCALVGGETAEHPGLMEANEFDLAGFCIGVGERDRLLDGTAARAGDAIVGLASSGLHANGYSLVRALVAQDDLDLRGPYQVLLRRVLGDAATDGLLAAEPAHELATLGEVLLTPTRIYARDVLAIREALVAAGDDVRGVAHITGGGLPGNVPRALPEALGARLDPGTWPMPSVMRLLGAIGALEDDELRATFNGGIGMVVIVPAAVAARTVDLARCARRAGLGRRRGRAAGRDRRGAVRGSGAVSGDRAPGPRRIAVGVSGSGSNLRALVAAAARGELGGTVTLVFADRACPALDWAVEQGIETILVPGGDDDGAGGDARRGRARRARPRRLPAARRAAGPRRVRAAGSSTSTRACSRRSRGCTPCATRSPPASPSRGSRSISSTRRSTAARSWPRRPSRCCRTTPRTRSSSGSTRSSTGCCRPRSRTSSPVR